MTDQAWGFETSVERPVRPVPILMPRIEAPLFEPRAG